MDSIVDQLIHWFPLEALQQGLLSTLSYPATPSSRIFWVFLLSSGIMGFTVLFVQAFKTSSGSWLSSALQSVKHLLNPKVFLKRSTLTDLSYLSANAIIRVLIIIPLVGSHLAMTLWVARSLQSNFGDGPHWAIPMVLAMSAYTLVFFVIEDFSRFFLHRTMHKIPLLWRFHKIHHSATRLTPLTLFRVHPVEMALYYTRGVMVFGFVSGVFIYCLGNRVSGWHILGVDLLGFAFNFFGANLRHSHIWFTFGPLEPWLISPAAHQIHHSRSQTHHDKNFGSCFAIWDRFFNSHFSPSKHKPRIRFGL